MSQAQVIETRRPKAAAEAPSRLPTIVAASIALVSVVIVALSLLVWIVRGFGPLPVSFGRSFIGIVGIVASATCFAAVGAVLAIRVRGNPIGWLFLVTGLALAVMLPVNFLVAAVHDQLRPASPPVVGIAWLRTAFATPLAVTLMIIAVLLFPTGRPIGRRWWAAIGVAVLGGSLLALATAVNPEGLVTYPTIPNPLAAPAGLVWLVDLARLVAVVLLLAGIALAAASIGVRYLVGSALIRVQLRWIVLAVAITALAGIPFLLTRYVVPVGETAGEFSAMLAQLGSCSIPIAAAFAATRYRLYQVDLLIGRTLVYVPLTAILAGLYAAFVFVFQRLFVVLTGEPSDLAILFTLILVTAVLTPIRKVVEGVVERRFGSTARAWAAERPQADPKGLPGRTPQAGANPHVAATVAAVPITAIPAAVHAPVAPPSTTSLEGATLHLVDAAGRVTCPVLGRAMAVADCLACGDFETLIRTPGPALICRGQITPELAAHDAS